MKMLKKILLTVFLLLGLPTLASPSITNIKALHYHPWGKVVLSYEVIGDILANAEEDQMPLIHVVATNKVSGEWYEANPMCLSGDIGIESGRHRVIWDTAAQGLFANSNKYSFVVSYRDAVYMVVDLSAGSNATKYPILYYNTLPKEVCSDEYKTNKLIFKRVNTGFYNNGIRDITISKSFFMGVFEVTQKQYELVVGNNPSFSKGDMLPVNGLSFETIRGSFIGCLCKKTGVKFDFPDKLEWQYVYRAGTTTTYYWGDAMDGAYAWYYNNSGLKPHIVGTRKPNKWGFYDMSGNVGEWTLASGDESYFYKQCCGGDFDNYASGCTWAYRTDRPADYGHDYEYEGIGFRLVGLLTD